MSDMSLAAAAACSPAVLTGLSWLSTYLLHSSLLLGTVWIALRAVPRLPDDLQEALWRAALLGGLLTTTWQIAGTAELEGAPAAPLALVQQEPAAEPRLALDVPEARAAEAATFPGPLHLPTDQGRHAVVAPIPPEVDLSPPHRAALQLTATPGSRWSSLALPLYATLAGLALIHLAFGRARFRRGLAGRRLLTHGDLPLRLLELVQRAGYRRAVRLTASDQLATPIAFGILQPEICIPTRALTRLGPDEQESMLAHELAHLIHHDPAWLLLSQVIQRLLFVQPMHHLAGRHMQQLAEYRCDAWAARQARRPTALARCLVEVADWLQTQPLIPAHAPGMVAAASARPSLLRQRVGRILQAPGSRRRPRTAALASLGLLTAAATALPSASWALAPPAEAQAAATPLPPITPLPTSPALTALDHELGQLELELARLRTAFAEAVPDAETVGLLQQLEQHVDRLRQRRDAMRAMLRELTAARRTDAPAPTAGQATPEDIHQAQRGQPR